MRVPVHDTEHWSGHEPTERRPTDTPDDGPADGSDGRTPRVAAVVRRVAFWLAIGLPGLYVPLVVAPEAFDWPLPGVGVPLSAGSVVLTLVGLHLLVVLVGHEHARSES
jgi:hypothetical protein